MDVAAHASTSGYTPPPYRDREQRTSVDRAASRNSWWESLKRVERPEGHYGREGNIETWKEASRVGKMEG